MARKTINVTIDTDGRDKGKTFKITEWSAAKAENWAIRAFLAMVKGGVQLPDGYADGGMAALAQAGFSMLCKASNSEVIPLINELMDCVEIVETKITRSMVEDDIEEVATRIRLRTEVFKLHVGF